MARYTAHIIDETAADLGNPSIVVMAYGDDIARGEEFVATYELPEDIDPFEVLREHGWANPRMVGDAAPGFRVCTVDPVDWITIVEEVTAARARAAAEFQRHDTAWHSTIRAAMHAGASATRLAKAAGRSRVRVYQISKGTR